MLIRGRYASVTQSFMLLMPLEDGAKEVPPSGRCNLRELFTSAAADDELAGVQDVQADAPACILMPSESPQVECGDLQFRDSDQHLSLPISVDRVPSTIGSEFISKVIRSPISISSPPPARASTVVSAKTC